jgi:hypothetical protein
MLLQGNSSTSRQLSIIHIKQKHIIIACSIQKQRKNDEPTAVLFTQRATKVQIGSKLNIKKNIKNSSRLQQNKDHRQSKYNSKRI